VRNGKELSCVREKGSSQVDLLELSANPMWKEGEEGRKFLEKERIDRRGRPDREIKGEGTENEGY